MSKELIKTIILSVCLIIVIAIFAVALFSDLDLKFIEVASIKTLLGKHDEIVREEEKLKSKQVEYETAIKKVDEAKNSYDSEKTKYDAISEETINIIKEATTEEYYDIEYMWITLGNYAKTNNLSIVMSEPGGSLVEESANKDGSESTDVTTSNQTTTGNTNTQATEQTQGTTTTNSSTIFKIKVKGSYLDVSDFIFEVENDKSLRFKLDNISMDYVSGNTIEANFDVKNLSINKE